MIRNPILPGFNPDPSILRVGDGADGRVMSR
jgi:beta-xylosidase